MAVEKVEYIINYWSFNDSKDKDTFQSEAESQKESENNEMPLERQKYKALKSPNTGRDVLQQEGTHCKW
jgi:hypothetical protein